MSTTWKHGRARNSKNPCARRDAAEMAFNPGLRDNRPDPDAGKESVQFSRFGTSLRDVLTAVLTPPTPEKITTLAGMSDMVAAAKEVEVALKAAAPRTRWHQPIYLDADIVGYQPPTVGTCYAYENELKGLLSPTAQEFLRVHKLWQFDQDAKMRRVYLLGVRHALADWMIHESKQAEARAKEKCKPALVLNLSKE